MTPLRPNPAPELAVTMQALGVRARAAAAAMSNAPAAAKIAALRAGGVI